MWWSQKVAQWLQTGQMTQPEGWLFIASALAVVLTIYWWTRRPKRK